MIGFHNHLFPLLPYASPLVYGRVDGWQRLFPCFMTNWLFCLMLTADWMYLCDKQCPKMCLPVVSGQDRWEVSLEL